MYIEFEQMIVAKLTAVAPPIYREQRDQFARSLPMLALFSVVFAVLLGGWLGEVIGLVRLLLIAPAGILDVVLEPIFWLVFLPPLLWLGSFVPLRDRRLVGWRLFVLGTALALVASLLRLNLISILFSGAILYFTVMCYDEFYRR